MNFDKEKKIERLELMCAIIRGPSLMKSFGGNYYVITFIDDTSRRTWVYALKA